MATDDARCSSSYGEQQQQLQHNVWSKIAKLARIEASKKLLDDLHNFFDNSWDNWEEIVGYQGSESEAIPRGWVLIVFLEAPGLAKTANPGGFKKHY